jgi:hypothetical protein
MVRVGRTIRKRSKRNYAHRRQSESQLKPDCCGSDVMANPFRLEQIPRAARRPELPPGAHARMSISRPCCSRHW